MSKKPIKQLCHALLLTLTFLSFSSYVLLSGFRFKIEHTSKAIAEENAEPGKETAKELTSSYLFEKTLSVVHFPSSDTNKFHFLVVKIPFFSLTPNSPPPDFFEC